MMEIIGYVLLAILVLFAAKKISDAQIRYFISSVNRDIARGPYRSKPIRLRISREDVDELMNVCRDPNPWWHNLFI